MKKFFLIIILLQALLLSAEITIETRGSDLIITGDFEIDKIEDAIHGDKIFSKVKIDQCELTGTQGGPELPIFSQLLALPDAGNYAVKSFNYDYQEIELTQPIYPHFYEDDSCLDSSIYQQKSWFPDQLVKISSPNIMRDYRFCQLAINPLQYLPSHDKLRVLKNIRLELQLDLSNTENPKISQRSIHTNGFDKIAAGSILNAPDFRGSDNGCYLFIVADDLEDVLEPLLGWKRKLGHPTEVAYMSELGTSEYDVKDYIQDAYDNWVIPPEYVVLVGDVSGSLVVPSFDIEGYLTPWIVSDHIYTMLEGDDYFPDVMVGRLSVRSSNELQTIIAKILNYEGQPYMDVNWFTRALMVTYVGEYYTGFYSPRETKNAVRDKLLDFNFTTVDTFYSPYQSSVYQLQSNINTGCSFVNYRGSGSPSYWWAGYSPLFDIQDIYGLNNGYMLPMVTSLTCGGGDFGSYNYSSCFGEVWLKAGSPSTPKGAIGFIGPSEHDTKTPFNNANDMGIYHGITQNDITGCYEMMLSGKMALYNNYPDYHSMDGYNDVWDSDMFYFHIYNLLGDPGLSIWVNEPKQIFATSETQLPSSATTLQATITDEDDCSGFTASLTSTDSLIATAITDIAGECNLYFNLEAGVYDLTFSKIGYIPITQTVTIINEDDLIMIDYAYSNPLFNNSTTNLEATFKNSTDQSLQINSTNVYIDNDDYIQLSDPNSYPITLSPGGSTALELEIISGLLWRNLEEIPVVIELSTSLNTYFFNTILTTISPELALLNLGITNVEESFIQGEQIEINPLVENIGQNDSAGFSLSCTSQTPGITIVNPQINYNSIPTGLQAQGSGLIIIDLAEDITTGDLATLLFEVIQADENVYNFTSQYPVGIINENAATRDSYGYFAYETQDNLEGDPFRYEWIELDPYYGGNGTRIEGGHVTPDGFTKVVDLPFQFQYYGEIYNQISVCQHGWIAMGATDLMFFRNRNIPSGVGAPAMIAPFWDKLVGDDVFGYFDEANHRYIVEWSRLYNGYSYDLETFQLILFDPTHYPTPTNDGPIMFQYNIIDDADFDEQYATAGIENYDQTDGLLISFNDTPAITAHALTSGSAILITTGNPDITDIGSDTIPPMISFLTNYPNPFKPSGADRSPATTISLQLSNVSNQENLKLVIYNIKGQKIKTFPITLRGVEGSGNTYSVTWDGSNYNGQSVGSGIYFYTLSLDGKIIGQQKMVLMK